MERENVKSLIEQYFSDGFHSIDICTKEIDISITNYSDVNFGKYFLCVTKPGVMLAIDYEYIKEITI